MFLWPVPSSLTSNSLDLRGPLPQVVVLTQNYGHAYYHFLVENLSRLTVVLDVILENPDIKVGPGPADSGFIDVFFHPPPDAYFPG